MLFLTCPARTNGLTLGGSPLSLLGTKRDLRVSGVPQAVVIEWSKNNSDIHQDHFVSLNSVYMLCQESETEIFYCLNLVDWDALHLLV